MMGAAARNDFLDHFCVGLVLLAGFGYAAYALGPKAWRKRWLTGAAGLLGRLPTQLGMRGFAVRMAAAANKGGSCGGCGSCGSNEPAARTASEVRVPLSTIGKRRRLTRR